ncbi:MAG: hypothetical protein KH704_01625 [Clostridiales bacterium]|nr:hypothetical protein [Clostridiales bacterium]
MWLISSASSAAPELQNHPRREKIIKNNKHFDKIPGKDLLGIALAAMAALICAAIDYFIQEEKKP